MTNDPAQPQFRLELIGEALAPLMQVYDDRGFVANGTGIVSFDPVLPGESDEEQLVIANQGNTDLTGISVTLAGDHPENFSIVAAPPPVIGAWGQAAGFTVRFSAAATGPRSAELRIHSSDMTASPWVIELRGEARESETSGDGSLDPSFGSAVDGEALFIRVEPDYELLVQPDEKIITVGTLYGETSSDFHVARFLPDGTPDPDFSGAGLANVDLEEWDQALCAALQVDGRLVVARISGDGVVVLRLLADGGLDPGFGAGGIVSSPAGGLEFSPRKVAIRPDGTILVAGFQYSHGWSTPVIVGLLADGMPDLDFGNAGVAVDPLTEWDAHFHAAAQADGSILATGWFDGEFRLVRFLPNGALDPSFGSGGRLTGRIGDQTAFTCLSLLPDARILLGGITLAEGRYENLALRLLSNGSPDPNFGNAGVALLQFPNPINLVDLAVQSDGRILVAGQTMRSGLSHIDMTRLNADGSIDNTFGDGGLAAGPAGSNPTLALASNGDLLLAARVYRQAEAGLGLFRFAMNLPAGGTFAVSPAPDVPAGDALSAQFAGWTTGSGPLSYQVLVNDVPIAPPSADPDLAFTAPLDPGLYRVVGRITDVLGGTTVVTRTLRVIGDESWWQALHFGGDPENGGDDEDPDEDGRSNQLEFATGGDPRSGADPGESARVDGDGFAFTYHRSKAAVRAGVSFTVEWTDDPAGEWTPATVPGSVVDQGDRERVTVPLPAGTAGRRFARLRVERP